MTKDDLQLINKSEYIQSLFNSLDDKIKLKLEKLQAIFDALNKLYLEEIGKENKNQGKITGLISAISRLDGIILHSVFNQLNPTLDNSPLRFFIYETTMINFYLDPKKYPQNKDILAKVHNLHSIEDVGGYIEVMNMINYNIDQLKIFDENTIEKSTKDKLDEELDTIKNMISEQNEAPTNVFVDEDGISYTK